MEEQLVDLPVILSRENHLSQKLDEVLTYIGKTPLRKMRFSDVNLFVKLEYHNYSGSIKDRAVFNILSNAIRRGAITCRTSLIESSSGNFAISLASMCRHLGISCTVVIDPNINADYEQVLQLLADRVIKVADRDETGGYLLTRLKKVKELCTLDPEMYWTNQYENPDNYLAYYEGMAMEIAGAFNKLDYAFIGVSTAGTIAGLSLRLKELFPDIRIVAVDVEGSVIFGSAPKKRFLSGLGASKVPPLIGMARIDEIITLPESQVVEGCWNLLKEQSILGGASAGAMYAAAKCYFNTHQVEKNANAVFLCPDKGSAYMDTVFNKQWVKKTYHQ
ncbi:MAG TPA: 2,3-diaminopropionate biosynthesis protein SbnA [Puia sp.]|uniref:2,3-diaminopropionate biosynthesis protein SbnA n=1 Tax=Puia sp. TaxID=2045100 RepID=UPI002CBA4B6E|nr:2,3-diaminopropionate biosynthesis protein SbnA [Puia sp.]HVU98518.1 2,3-diaminopropionate biosynthesis protein SbnA [Puia sp.]